MSETTFVPVLLGSDVNVYGMARSFHEAYGLRSVAVAKGRLGATSNSRIVTVAVTEPRLEEDDVFVDTLIRFAARYDPEIPLLLVPCGDNYIGLLARNQDKLRPYYRFAVSSAALLQRLGTKETFYEVCTEHGFLFPKTDTCTPDTYKGYRPPFDFPVVIKPSNSVAYWNCHFPHKKKVFVAYSQGEFDAILTAIYGSDYQDHLIIQEFIPGDDSHMRVMNLYRGTDGRVRLAALGQALLEEHSPEGIGSYAAILPITDEELSRQMIGFLDDIGYVGFANFDMKFDDRDGRYKLFEMNPRQGRSSYFSTAAGGNLARILAEDVIFGRDAGLTVADREVLWTILPDRIIFRYVADDTLRGTARRLIREKKVCRSLDYKPDRSLKRRWYFCKNQISYYKKYKKYFGNKGLTG